jgi:hypothetical protein
MADQVAEEHIHHVRIDAERLIGPYHLSRHLQRQRRHPHLVREGMMPASCGVQAMAQPEVAGVASSMPGQGIDQQAKPDLP